MQQMANDRKYFLLGGVFSCMLFLLFLSLFVIFLFQKKNSVTYGLEKKKYISVSLVTAPKQQNGAKKQVKKAHKKKKTIQRKQVDAIQSDVDIDSLFNNVWTKKIHTKTKPKPKIDAKRIAEIQKSVAISDAMGMENKKGTAKGKKAQSKVREKTSSGEEVNEYLAKIHSRIYEHFFPPQNSEGNVVEAVIELSPLGKVVDFRILHYSSSEALNNEADEIKNRIKTVIFPKSPSHTTQRVVIKLIPEYKE